VRLLRIGALGLVHLDGQGPVGEDRHRQVAGGRWGQRTGRRRDGRE
jgi:hypothetical protein